MYFSFIQFRPIPEEQPSYIVVIKHLDYVHHLYFIIYPITQILIILLVNITSNQYLKRVIRRAPTVLLHLHALPVKSRRFLLRINY